MTDSRPAAARPSLDFTICGLNEIAGCFDPTMTHAISILDPETEEPSSFAALAVENLLRLRFHDVIEQLPTMTVPDVGHVQAILQFGAVVKAHAAPRVLIHCHAGISRSTAAAIILLAQHGTAPEAAVADVVARRPKAWPNLRMIEIGDRMLKHEQRLVHAVRRHHARALAARPELREIFTQCGRGREVEGLEGL